jgi:hypothetical protein
MLLNLSTYYVRYKAVSGLPFAAPELNLIQARHKVLIGATRHVGKAEQQTMLIEYMSLLASAV